MIEAFQYFPFSSGWFSTISALICILAREEAHPVPAFDSFMPLVSGDLAPIEILEAVGALVPVTNPGAKISLLSGPRGWQVAGTSSYTIVDVSPLPPRFLYDSGIPSSLYV